MQLVIGGFGLSTRLYVVSGLVGGQRASKGPPLSYGSLGNSLGQVLVIELRLERLIFWMLLVHL